MTVKVRRLLEESPCHHRPGVSTGSCITTRRAGQVTLKGEKDRAFPQQNPQCDKVGKACECPHPIQQVTHTYHTLAQ